MQLKNGKYICELKVGTIIKVLVTDGQTNTITYLINSNKKKKKKKTAKPQYIVLYYT